MHSRRASRKSDQHGRTDSSGVQPPDGRDRRRNHMPCTSNGDRRREVAALLARGVIRWRRRARVDGIIDAKKSPPSPETRLELPGETPLSVGTRGFTPRSDGDER